MRRVLNIKFRQTWKFAYFHAGENRHICIFAVALHARYACDTKFRKLSNARWNFTLFGHIIRVKGKEREEIKKQNASSNVAVLFKASSSARRSIAKLSTVSAKAVFTYVRSVRSYGWIYPRPYGNRKLHDPLGWTKETEGARVKVGDAVTPQLPTYVSLHVAHNSPTTPRCLWLQCECVRTYKFACTRRRKHACDLDSIARKGLATHNSNSLGLRLRLR